MVGPLILAIDEGTTNAKAIAVDRDGRVVARGSQSLTLQHPQPRSESCGGRFHRGETA